MSEREAEVNFYDGDRDIKISRFFEVAKYLTENNLWKDVENLMRESPIIGERVILDMHLGNAVKVIMLEHARKAGTLHTDELVRDTLRCSLIPKHWGPDEPPGKSPL